MHDLPTPEELSRKSHRLREDKVAFDSCCGHMYVNGERLRENDEAKIPPRKRVILDGKKMDIKLSGKRKCKGNRVEVLYIVPKSSLGMVFIYFYFVYVHLACKRCAILNGSFMIYKQIVGRQMIRFKHRVSLEICQSHSGFDGWKPYIAY